jgi:hypothetical protein
MPTFDEIVARAAALDYPIAENEFTVTKQNPAPTLPFICYQRVERYTGTDQAVRIKTTEASFEFYTDRRPSAADKAAIAEFEAKVLQDIDFVKTQTFIRDENMTMTAYEFVTVEKLRKG